MSGILTPRAAVIDPCLNIVLIGMAGSGKSSIGRRIAAELHRDFIDTDELIAKEAGCPLQQIIGQEGLSGFLRLEEKILLGLDVSSHVIATGGSSVYSRKGMEHLQLKGLIVYLEVKLPLLKKRIRNFAARGLVKVPEQSFDELYHERIPLYRKYADLTYSCGDKNKKEVSKDLVRLLQKNNSASS